MSVSFTERNAESSDRLMQRVFVVSSAIVIAFLVSLIVRSTGSYYTPVDGWGVDVFELSMCAACISRVFDKSWRRGQFDPKVFPLALGAACAFWAFGDVATTIESLGGVTPPTPSVA